MPPKQVHPGREVLAAIRGAQPRSAADATQAFADQFAAHSKVVAEITDDLHELLACYDLPAEHRKHLHTTDAIESTFATVRLRQRVTKGPGCCAA